MLHLNPDGTLIHEAPSNWTLPVLDFIDGFKDEATQNLLPLKQMFEKSVSAYVEKNQIETTYAFEDFSLACPEFENGMEMELSNQHQRYSLKIISFMAG